MNAQRPRAPADLAKRGRGRRFWAAIIAKYELRPDELEILAEVCRMLDEADRLRALAAEAGPIVSGSRGQDVVNPSVVELRQLRQEIRRGLAALHIPDEPERAERKADAASWEARRKARARWS